MVPKFLVFLTSTQGSTAGDVSMYALALKVYDPKVGCFIVDTDTRVRAHAFLDIWVRLKVLTIDATCTKSLRKVTNPKKPLRCAMEIWVRPKFFGSWGMLGAGTSSRVLRARAATMVEKQPKN